MLPSNPSIPSTTVTSDSFRIPFLYNQFDDAIERKTQNIEESQEPISQTSKNKIANVTRHSLPVQQTNSNSIANRKVSFGSQIINRIKETFIKIKSIFAFHIIIKPSIDKFISQQLKKVDPRDYKKNYTKLAVSYHGLIKELKSKYKSISLFSDNQRRGNFENMLAKKVDKILEKNKLPLLTKSEIEKSSYNCILFSHVENTPLPLELANDLIAIPSHQMPIALLSKIKLNKENQDVILKTWKRILIDLPEVGSLDKLNSPHFNKETLVRIDCAIKVLEILKLAPRSLDPELDKLINHYSENNQSDLENFIVHENSMLKNPIDLELSNLIEKQDIYQSKIKPKLDHLIKKVIDSSQDSTELVNILTGAKLEESVKIFQEGLDNSQKILFSKEVIEKMFVKEIEILALTTYGFNRMQIDNLKSLRESKEDEFEIDPYLQENAALYGKNVVENIKKFGYTHPSNISTESIIALIDITRITSLNKLNYRTTEEQKKEIVSALQKLAKAPEIAKLLVKFKKRKEVTEETRNEKSLTPGMVGFFIKLWKKIRPSKIQESYKLPAGVSQEAVKIVLQYFKIQKAFPKIVESLPKGKALIQKYEINPASVNSSERLTLNEIGNLTKLSDFSKKFEIYEKLGLETHPMIANFYSAAKQALEVRNALESILLPAFSKHYSSGDIVLYRGKRKAKWKGREGLSSVDKLINIFLKGKTHGMKVYHEGEKLRGSEISKAYENTEMRIYDIAISDVWRLNIESLVPNSSIESLKEVFGNDWKTVLQKFYGQIEDEIHGAKSKNYEKIVNSTNRKVRAGLADWKWLFKIIKPISGLRIKGHRKKYEQDFKEIHKKFMDGKKVDEPQICSEFTSKTTLVAVVELNKIVAKLIAERKPELLAVNVHADLIKKGASLPLHVVHYLNGLRKFGKEYSITKKAEKALKNILRLHNYSSKKIDLILRLNNEEIIELPYDKREKMSAIHPGRMIELLKKKKCITQVNRPKEFDNLIQI